MQAKECRKMARESLKGMWGQAVLITLTYTAITIVLALIPFIGQLASAVISPVLTFGLIKHFINLKNNENVGYADFIKYGFENFVMVWKTIFRVLLKLLLPIIVAVIGTLLFNFGITMSIISGTETTSIIFLVLGIIVMLAGYVWYIPLYYKYICTMNELAYDSNRSSKEVVEQSGAYMVGNRVGIFWLQLTFIGWTILAAMTCYIGMLWLLPYMQIATILFYESVSGRLNSKPEEIENDVSYNDPIF